MKLHLLNYSAQRKERLTVKSVWLRMSEEGCVVVFSTHMDNFSFYWAGKNRFPVQIESNQIRL